MQDLFALFHMGGGEIILVLVLIMLLAARLPKDWPTLRTSLSRRQIIWLDVLGLGLAMLSFLVLWAITYLQR